MNIKNNNLENNTIIDIREPHEYKIDHIPNSINISQDLLELIPERYLSKNKKYNLYCEKGIKSLKLSNELNLKGYNTNSINGGYQEWKTLYKFN